MVLLEEKSEYVGDDKPRKMEWTGSLRPNIILHILLTSLVSSEEASLEEERPLNLPESSAELLQLPQIGTILTKVFQRSRRSPVVSRESGESPTLGKSLRPNGVRSE